MAAVVVSTALGGCAHKRPSGADLAAAAPLPAGTAEEYGSTDDTGNPLAALQANLVSSAGADRVLFALDSYGLDPAARQVLARQAAWLRTHPTTSFTVEGHCDERGTREYNLGLGDRRAKSAADFLIANGIDPARIRTISYGKERPEAEGSDEASYAQNRRAVSIVVQGR